LPVAVENSWNRTGWNVTQVPPSKAHCLSRYVSTRGMAKLAFVKLGAGCRWTCYMGGTLVNGVPRKVGCYCMAEADGPKVPIKGMPLKWRLDRFDCSRKTALF